MGMLDFIRNRTSQQASEKPNVETAKEMYAREASQDRANGPTLTSMQSDQLAKAQALGAKIQTIPTEPDPNTLAPGTPASAPAPISGTDNQQPMIQPGMAQDKGAPDLSPTSAQMGVKENDLQVRPADTPSRSPQAPKSSRSMSPDL